ncbi:PepSY domain-containing protein [Stenotrophomonas sp. ZAC14D2_NAIMI4_7]|uniref:PepSY-associated TM helix domain-containing protein n=1 Tax=Stenotrophomonas sp. ZAC14D2_NAIMI4_7 TaxID=2072405 RepID=UPI000D53DF4A|nr:PepSY-associated TM helix domain-containing protein [Stenotrophomonas sp. ZAC14D2_NAIMI4_7]AWH17737.1 PepSY domain-containing protein [Stenotrophomonas sp. ZAC14D2_NAIMI4_7]
MSTTTAPRPGKPRGIRQTMSDLHIWVGLLAGWILYAMFLTGTASYFRDEVSRYTRPEIATPQQLPPAAETSARLITQLQHDSPGARQISLTLPTTRTPWVAAMWAPAGGGGGRHGFQSGLFDAATGTPLPARDTAGGDFFYAFHFNLHYMPALWARWIVGLCAMFMLVAIVSGVITHKKIFADFFTFRWGKGQRSWLDGHAAVSVLGLPFHFMITWSGLVMLAVLYMPWGLSKLPDKRQQQQVTSEMRLSLPRQPAAGVAAALVDVAPLVAQAEQRWGVGSIGGVQVQNPGDAAARVAVVRAQSSRVSTTPHYLLFDGSSGRLLQAKEHSGAAAQTQGVLYGLHLGRFADAATRWLYFVVSLAGTAMVGTGLVLWTVKRRSQLPDPQRPYFGFRLVERLNIATVAGLSVAMAAFFWANRLLPISLQQRAAWEVHVFFIVWAATLVHACLRTPKRAWVEQFCLAALLLALVPVLNATTTARPLWVTLPAGDWAFAGTDLTLLALAGLHACLAWRTWRFTPRTTRARAPRTAAAAASGVAS